MKPHMPPSCISTYGYIEYLASDTPNPSDRDWQNPSYFHLSFWRTRIFCFIYDGRITFPMGIDFMKMTLPGPLYHCTVLCCLLTLFQFCSHGYGQLTPQESLESLKTAPGLEASLFASEPLVNNPSAMDIDPLGRIWVSEGVN